MSKSSTYKILKISSTKIEQDKKSKKYIVKFQTLDTCVSNGEIISLSDNQMLHKIRDYHKDNPIKDTTISNFIDDLINIVIPSDSKRNAEKHYVDVATNNFTFNGIEYKRLCSGSGQIRNNTITFVKKELYNYLFDSLCCGLKPLDFGDDFNAAKFNAYFGLSMSGVNFLKDAPRVCVVDDFEGIRPHRQVNYITTTSKKEGRKTIVSKDISDPIYNDIEDGEYRFPALNSFDGQGLCDPAYAKKVALELGYLNNDGTGYLPSEYIIRAPWVKGLVVTFDWKAYCSQYGVTEIKDLFGDIHKINDIDLLLSKSQFKMWKIYAKKGGWKYHVQSMQEHNLLWGIVTPNKQKDDEIKTLNYQYINALTHTKDSITSPRLPDETIDSLCYLTKDFLSKLCNGNIEEIYRVLIKRVEDSSCDSDADGKYDDTKIIKPILHQSLLQKAVTHNYKLLQDEHIQNLIYKECASKFKAAKIGKLLCCGNYQFLISDPVAQIQWIIKSSAVDGGVGNVEVTGLIPVNHVYSSYWNSGNNESIVLMRSPLIDQSEVAVRTLLNDVETQKWYQYIKSGIVLSIHDLTTLQLQNCDFDGDRVFTSNSELLKNATLENPLPLLYPAASTQLVGSINETNLILADKRGLNSKVGQISNKSASFYAKLPKYEIGSEEYNILLNRIKILGEIVGVEIDKIKTGIPPKIPTDWATKSDEAITYEKNGKNVTKSLLDEKQTQERYRHNALVPNEKPYFMRYVYPQDDTSIQNYNSNWNKVCRFNYNKKLETLLEIPEKNLSEKEKNTVKWYLINSPINDSDCTMNRICHIFEQLDKRLKTKVTAKSMLPDFVTQEELSDDILQKVKKLSARYYTQRRILTRDRNTNSADTSANIAKNTAEMYRILYEYLQDSIMQLCKNDVQTAFNHMVKAVQSSNGEYDFIWNVLGDKIIEVIPQNAFKKKGL